MKIIRANGNVKWKAGNKMLNKNQKYFHEVRSYLKTTNSTQLQVFASSGNRERESCGSVKSRFEV